jgi:hypothetical protein
VSCTIRNSSEPLLLCEFARKSSGKNSSEELNPNYFFSQNFDLPSAGSPLSVAMKHKKDEFRQNAKRV